MAAQPHRISRARLTEIRREADVDDVLDVALKIREAREDSSSRTFELQRGISIGRGRHGNGAVEARAADGQRKVKDLDVGGARIFVQENRSVACLDRCGLLEPDDGEQRLGRGDVAAIGRGRVDDRVREQHARVVGMRESELSADACAVPLDFVRGRMVWGFRRSR